jgi:hypothetical protein
VFGVISCNSLWARRGQRPASVFDSCRCYSRPDHANSAHARSGDRCTAINTNPPARTNPYADDCPIFIARGKTHDPSSDFDAYIDVDIRANSHANRNAATNCYGYPDDTTCNSDNGRGQYPTF